MGAFSFWHWMVVLLVALLLFGGSGRIPNMMSDIAKGIRKFRKGLKEEEEEQDGNSCEKEGISPKSVEYREKKTLVNTDTEQENRHSE